MFRLLLDIFSILVWSWTLLEFFSKGLIELPATISSIYLMLLGYYASEKELRRKKGGRWRERYGEFFVYAWALTLVLLVAFYRWGGRKLGYDIPAELPVIVGGVLVIFFVTQYLKIQHKSRQWRDKQKTSRH